MKIRSLFLFLLLNMVFVAGVYSQTTAKTYVDKKNGFSFTYPSDFKILTGTKAKSETAFGDPGAGVKLISVTPGNIPGKFHGWYEFNVWVSADPKDKCVALVEGENIGEISAGEPEEGSPKTRMIDGHNFYAYNGEEGGMSKSIGVMGYRGTIDGKCWQVQSLSYQVSAFDDYRPFNHKIIDKAFEQFVLSFKFTGGK